MKSILIVEDDITYGMMLKTWLGKKGFQVASVSSIARAQKHLETEGADLILSDLRLPDKDGIDLSGGERQKVALARALVREHPDRFRAFADVTASGAYFIEQTPYILEEAVEEYGLSGLKLHPTNLHMDADDLRLVPVLRKAAELGVPVMFHANPCRLGFHDNCAPDKINRMIQVFPDLEVITAHLGGMKWQDALTGCTWVDMSYILPKLAGLYGIEQVNRILRAFGPERLIFATDFPDGEYDAYFDILDQMDFSDAEITQIAWGNIAGLLALEDRP